jgi:prepilin-type N-terminal cleavage/methylation domain-containing protein
VKRGLASYAHSQAGYTLIEVVIASAIGAILMTALTSVILTSVGAANIATSRVEASSQIRNFEFFAYDDFARSPMPSPNGCVGLPPTQCTIALTGFQASNSTTPVTAAYPVTYTWDVVSGFLDRAVGSNPAIHAATNVIAFSYSDDVATRTVVVSLTVKVQSYTEYQTFRFYPRVG